MIIMLVISKRSHLEKKNCLFVVVSSKHIPPKKKSKSKGDTAKGDSNTKVDPLSLAPWLVAQQRIQLYEITWTFVTFYGSAVRAFSLQCLVPSHGMSCHVFPCRIKLSLKACWCLQQRPEQPDLNGCLVKHPFFHGTRFGSSN